MPEIKFDDDTLRKVKDRTGIYHHLKVAATPGNLPLIEVFMLRVKAGFLDYARRHGCKPDMEATEWRRFEKLLRKYL